MYNACGCQALPEALALVREVISAPIGPVIPRRPGTEAGQAAKSLALMAESREVDGPCWCSPTARRGDFGHLYHKVMTATGLAAGAVGQNMPRSASFLVRKGRPMNPKTIATICSPFLLIVLAGTALAAQPGDQVTPQTPSPVKPQMPAVPAGGLATDPSTKPKAESAIKTVKGGEKQRVTVTDQMTVDMSVKDENISSVLEMLAVQSRKNIIASKNVTGKVSADLFGVTFYEALDSVLNVNGFAYQERGNFIYVYTQQELDTIVKASKPRVAKVLRLNYLTAPDAAEFVKPMLSQGGEIKHNNKTENFSIADSAPTGKDDFALAATLVVIDYEENIRAVEQLIIELDTKPSQVLVETTVLSASVQEDNAFGIDFSLIFDYSFKDFANAALGGPFGVVDAIRRQPTNVGRGEAISSDVGGTGRAGGFKVGIVQDNVSVFLRALDAVTNTTVLANPKILALNRQPSRVLVGQRIGYLSTTATETSTTQTVQFLDTGVQLYVRPFINANKNEIRMELRPQFSRATQKNVPGPNGSQVIIPDEDTQEITTNVIVPDGMTVVLGGLFREDVVSGRQQVPLLGDIPLVGSAFRGQNDSTTRSEIIFLLTPRIVSDPAMAKLGDAATDQVDRVRAGSRQGQLFFGRDRMTATLNMEAEAAARDGESAKAMWLIGRSLSLNANQPEVYRLRERITGEREQWPTRSLFEDVIDPEVNARVGDGKVAPGIKGGTPWNGVKVPKHPSREFPLPAGTPQSSMPPATEPAATTPAAAVTAPIAQPTVATTPLAPAAAAANTPLAGFITGAPVAQALPVPAGATPVATVPTPAQTEPELEEPGSLLSGAGDDPASDDSFSGGSGSPAEQPN